MMYYLKKKIHPIFNHQYHLCIVTVQLITLEFNWITEKFICKKDCTQIIGDNIRTPTKRCSAGTLYCTHCPKLSKSATIWLELFYRQKTQCIASQLRSRIKFSKRLEKKIGAGGDSPNSKDWRFNRKNLQDKLQSCNLFLVAFKIGKERHKVFLLCNRNTSSKNIGKKFKHDFENLNFWNLGFIWKKRMEDSDIFTYTKTIPR